FTARRDHRDGLRVLHGKEPGGLAHSLLPDLVLVGRFLVPALPEGRGIAAERPETNLAHERPVAVLGADDFGHGCPPEPSLLASRASRPGGTLVAIAALRALRLSLYGESVDAAHLRSGDLAACDRACWHNGSMAVLRVLTVCTGNVCRSPA